MNIVEIMQTINDEGLTVTEMRAKRRMNIALKAFGKWQKKPIIKEVEEEVINTPDLDKNFYNLFT